MSRTIREQMPGAAFHIVARTQGRKRWFKGAISERVESILVEGVTSSDAMLMSHTVMPNHFHLVLRQGQRPLGWVMQPIMRRIALLVQRERKVSGHVFERAYRSRRCSKPRRLRRTVIYSHINPLRASLCTDLADYPWTSHEKYIVTSDSVITEDVAHVLRLFSDERGQSFCDMSRNYVNYLEWRLEKDRCEIRKIPFEVPEPIMPVGDEYFFDFFVGRPPSQSLQQADLRDTAIQVLRRIEPQMNINDLRRRYLPRHARETRRQVIAALLTARYRGCAIANFFRVSDSLVSSIAKAMRYGSLSRN